jgi:hypothetical protein
MDHLKRAHAPPLRQPAAAALRRPPRRLLRRIDIDPDAVALPEEARRRSQPFIIGVAGA